MPDIRVIVLNDFNSLLKHTDAVFKALILWKLTDWWIKIDRPIDPLFNLLDLFLCNLFIKELIDFIKSYRIIFNFTPWLVFQRFTFITLFQFIIFLTILTIFWIIEEWIGIICFEAIVFCLLTLHILLIVIFSNRGRLLLIFLPLFALSNQFSNMIEAIVELL